MGGVGRGVSPVSCGGYRLTPAEGRRVGSAAVEVESAGRRRLQT